MYFTAANIYYLQTRFLVNNSAGCGVTGLARDMGACSGSLAMPVPAV